MPSKSKSKGNRWEREVATFLSDIYGESFLRVPSSGAFVGGKNAFRKDTLASGQIQSKKGDIHPPDNWTYLNVECKSYADFPFHQLFTTDVKLLDNWIEQTLTASDANDVNIIFMKFNRKGKWVCFKQGPAFILKAYITYRGWIFCSWDDFWNSDTNKNIFKMYSTAGI